MRMRLDLHSKVEQNTCAYDLKLVNNQAFYFSCHSEIEISVEEKKYDDIFGH